MTLQYTNSLGLALRIEIILLKLLKQIYGKLKSVNADDFMMSKTKF